MDKAVSSDNIEGFERGKMAGKMKIVKPYKKKVSSLCTYFRYSGSPSTESQTRPTTLRQNEVLAGFPGDDSITATELASFTFLFRSESEATGEMALISVILHRKMPRNKISIGFCTVAPKCPVRPHRRLRLLANDCPWLQIAIYFKAPNVNDFFRSG